MLRTAHADAVKYFRFNKRSRCRTMNERGLVRVHNRIRDIIRTINRIVDPILSHMSIYYVYRLIIYVCSSMTSLLLSDLAVRSYFASSTAWFSAKYSAAAQ